MYRLPFAEASICSYLESATRGTSLMVPSYVENPLTSNSGAKEERERKKNPCAAYMQSESPKNSSPLKQPQPQMTSPKIQTTWSLLPTCNCKAVELWRHR